MFHNLGAPAKHRSFIKTQLSSGRYVTINGTNYFLAEDEVEHLLSAIDEIAPIYINASIEVERTCSSMNFSCSQSGRFPLMKITRNLWNQMLIFANEHNYDTGNTSWHIFDRNEHYIKIQVGGENRTLIKAEQHLVSLAESFVSNSLRHADEEVWLCWDSSLMLDFQEDPNSHAWNAETTYLWLRDQFIAQVGRRNNIYQSLRNEIICEMGNILALSTFSPLTSITEFRTLTQLRQAILQIELFYAVENNIFIDCNQMDSACTLAASLLDISRNAEEIRTHSQEMLSRDIFKNLDWWKQQNTGEQLGKILSTIRILIGGESYRIEESILIAQVRNAITPLWEHYKTCFYLQRMTTLH